MQKVFFSVAGVMFFISMFLVQPVSAQSVTPEKKLGELVLELQKLQAQLQGLTASYLLTSGVVQTAATGTIIGYVDTIALANNKNGAVVTGWACKKGSTEKLSIFAFKVAPQTAGGMYVGSTVTDTSSADKIRALCGVFGGTQRFSLALTALTQAEYSGDALIVYAQNSDKTLTPLIMSASPAVIPALSPDVSQQCTNGGCVYPGIARQNTINILVESNPDTVTHRLISKGVTLGVNANGGGYINELKLSPDGVDIVGPVSSSYGRGGQSAIRDSLHASVYNPTQAGFSERGGTRVALTNPDSKTINLPLRKVVLFNGDGLFDFTQNEKAAADRNVNDNGKLDADMTPDVANRQDLEVASEFDYQGDYTVCNSNVLVTCFKHTYEYIFARNTDAIRQFVQLAARTVDGKPVLDTAYLGNSITDAYTKIDPAVVQAANEFDLSNLYNSWVFHIDNNVWNPRFRFLVKSDGSLESATPRTSKFIDSDASVANRKQILILSDESNAATGTALGFYRPSSAYNKKQTVIKTAVGKELSREDRSVVNSFRDDSERLKNMGAAVGSRGDMTTIQFLGTTKGLLNPRKLNTAATPLAESKFESIHSEVYILVGTPKDIAKAVMQIDQSVQR